MEKVGKRQVITVRRRQIHGTKLEVVEKMVSTGGYHAQPHMATDRKMEAVLKPFKEMLTDKKISNIRKFFVIGTVPWAGRKLVIAGREM